MNPLSGFVNFQSNRIRIPNGWREIDSELEFIKEHDKFFSKEKA